MGVELGVIEGYYGTPWTWAEREDQVAFLQPYGYSFYIYAPKADEFLRRRWRDTPPTEEAEALARLAAHCRSLGVRFGVGLSPFEIYRDVTPEALAALREKLSWLNDIGVEILGVLFDDMRGDLPDLAETQIRVVNFIAEHSKAGRLVLCPTYYSDEPDLDRYFGARPPGYLETLGKRLDPRIDMFWTGEETCAREFSPGHLDRVAEILRRKPFLWDNYPVNDGPRMSPRLHLQAFTGRPGVNAGHIAAHAINPALQPVLTRIPAITLAESYRLGEGYEYGQAFDRASLAVMGPELAALVRRHLMTFQEFGLDRLSEDSRERLRKRYGAFDHPGAREILKWVNGEYLVTPETMAGA